MTDMTTEAAVTTTEATTTEATTPKPKAARKPKAAKPTKNAKRKLLTSAERSAIARLAAFKAHLHKTFQSDRTPAERSIQVKLFSAAKSAPLHKPAKSILEAAHKVRLAADAAERKAEANRKAARKAARKPKPVSAPSVPTTTEATVAA